MRSGFGWRGRLARLWACAGIVAGTCAGASAQCGDFFIIDQASSGQFLLRRTVPNGSQLFATVIGTVNLSGTALQPSEVRGLTFDDAGTLWAAALLSNGEEYLLRFDDPADNANGTVQYVLDVGEPLTNILGLCPADNGWITLVVNHQSKVIRFDPYSQSGIDPGAPHSDLGHGWGIARFAGGGTEYYLAHDGNSLQRYVLHGTPGPVLEFVPNTQGVRGLTTIPDDTQHLYGYRYHDNDHEIVKIDRGNAAIVSTTPVSGPNVVWAVASPLPPEVPTSVVATPGTLCTDDSVDLSAVAPPGVTIEWFEGTCSGSSIGSTVSGQVLTHTPTSMGQVDFFARSKNSLDCVSDCATVQVTVNPKPTLDVITPLSVDFCIGGDPVTLEATSSGMVQWFEGDCDAGTPLVGPNPQVSPSQTTAYSVRGELNNCFSPCVTVTVNVHPSTAVTVTALTPEICEGEQAMLQADANYPVEWFVDGCGVGSPIGTEPLLAIELDEDTTIFARAVAPCDAPCDSAMITVLPAPSIVIDTPDSSICMGDEITLQATSTAPIEWFANECGVGEPIDTGPEIMDMPRMDTTYYARAVGAMCNSPCASVEVTVIDGAQILAQPQGGGFCVGDNVTLSVVASPGATFQWRKDGAPIAGATDDQLLIGGAGHWATGVYDVEISDDCGNPPIDSEPAELWVGQRRVTGFAPGSDVSGMTTGGTTVVLEGEGLLTGMGVRFWTRHGSAVADTTTFGATPDGSELTVIVPPIAPGCDCEDGEPFFAEIEITNGCTPWFVATGLSFRYDIARVAVTQDGDGPTVVGQAQEGQCIVFEKLSGGSISLYYGSLNLNSSHRNITITAEDVVPPEVIRIDSSSPSLPVIRFDGVPESVCVSDLQFVGGATGAEITNGARPVLLRDHFFNNSGTGSLGGGITIAGNPADPCATHPAILDCRIYNNEGRPGAAASAGGIHIEDAGATVVGTQVTNNDRSGVYIADNCADLLIVDSLVGSHPNGVKAMNGGGVHWTTAGTEGGPPVKGTLLRTFLASNEAAGDGAGLYLDENVAPDVIQNWFLFNQCTDIGAQGGGIFVQAHDASGPEFPICENVLLGNMAQVGGAVAILDKAACQLTRNLVVCNEAIQNDPKGRAAYYAAGIYLVDAGPTLFHNTLYMNTGVGGGISAADQSGGIHADGPISPFQAHYNIASENSGWEILLTGNCPTALPLNDNLVFDPTDPNLIEVDVLLCQFGNHIIGLDPEFVSPSCEFLDPWSDFDVSPTSPATILGSDGLYRGAITSAGFMLGECAPAIPGDCNTNGVPDWIDILLGTVPDDDFDGVPDICVPGLDDSPR